VSGTEAARDIGSRLRFAREMRGLKQVEAARRVGAHPVNYCDWEQGRKTPSLARLLEIVETLGLDPRDLFPEWFRGYRKEGR
jgi:transcriptional regulator with XRE-family HTH domain